MIIGAIIVGILILALMILGEQISDRCGGDFEFGEIIGAIITLLFVMEICLVHEIIEKPKPSALDVYRDNTELEITFVNGTPIDTVVVFQRNLQPKQFGNSEQLKGGEK